MLKKKIHNAIFDVKLSTWNASHTVTLYAIYVELSCSSSADTPYSVPTPS
jgi:hypothetical protein